MSMGKSELDRCLESIGRARDRMEYIPQDDLRWVVLRALLHLANHVRQRVADHPALYPHQLNAAIENLAGRIEALENSDNPVYGKEEESAERVEACAPGWMWDWLIEDIQRYCNTRGWSDIDASVAWMMGRDALLRARSLGVRLPHDPPDKETAA